MKEKQRNLIYKGLLPLPRSQQPHPAKCLAETQLEPSPPPSAAHIRPRLSPLSVEESKREKESILGSPGRFTRAPLCRRVSGLPIGATYAVNYPTAASAALLDSPHCLHADHRPFNRFVSATPGVSVRPCLASLSHADRFAARPVRLDFPADMLCRAVDLHCNRCDCGLCTS